MDRRLAIELLNRLNAAQTVFHSGGGDDELRLMLDDEVVWRVPGGNAIAGTHSGIEEVMQYFAHRRELSSGTFRTHRRDVLTGDGDWVAALTDGTARIGGEDLFWSTVGLYRFRDGKLVECRLLPLDPGEFDRIWSPTR
jgi:ketosteroid isomerase-like protein